MHSQLASCAALVCLLSVTLCKAISDVSQQEQMLDDAVRLEIKATSTQVYGHLL